MQAKLIYFNELGKILEDSQAYFFFLDKSTICFYSLTSENMPKVNRCTINLANQKVPCF